MSINDFLFYFNLGWSHIVSFDALDHQLFILVLVILYSARQIKQVLILVTAFTIGHSVTLALSAFDVIRLNIGWIEFLIPCTIFITALSNIFKKSRPNADFQLNYYLAFFFGLIHGMGFANSIRMMLAKDQQLGWGLFGFNVGLEVGQIVFVILVLILSGIALSVFKVKKREWILFVSSVVFALALQMSLQRLPF